MPEITVPARPFSENSLVRSFTVTKGSPRRFRVLPLIERHGWEPTFVCDTDEQRSSLINLGVAPSAIVLPGISPGAGIQGVSRARDFVGKKLMSQGEWSVWVDDNLTDITGLCPALSPADAVVVQGPVGVDLRAEFAHSLTRSELAYHFHTTVDRAESLGTIYAAFANETNYYFRRRKWQHYGYCRTQLALYKNDGSGWFPFDSCMLEDWYKSLDVVARYGCIVINRHVKAEKPLFEQGGIGPFAARLPWLRDNCKRLAAMYPGLVTTWGDGRSYGNTEAKNFSLRFLKRTRRTVDAWRREHGFLHG